MKEGLTDIAVDRENQREKNLRTEKTSQQTPEASTLTATSRGSPMGVAEAASPEDRPESREAGIQTEGTMHDDDQISADNTMDMVHIGPVLTKITK